MSHRDSWQDLKDQFVHALGDRNEVHLWFSIWNLFLNHPWYRRQLKYGARHAIRESGVPHGWQEEIEQEAMLFLGRSLRKAPDLHMDARHAEEHFPGWIGTIIHRDCLQAIRRLRASNSRTVELQKEDLPMARQADIEAMIELSIVLDELNAADRKILMLRAKGMTVKEIAAAMNTSYSKTYRMLQGALARARRLLE